MRDLADFMNDALAERSGSLSDLPTTSVGERVRRKVRFRRARRHTLEAGGVAAIVAVLGTATWLGTNGRHDPVPAVSPTTSTPSPTPSPTPSDTSPAVADEIPGLPPTYAMPPGLLERTTTGWVLSIYRSDGNSDTGQVTYTVVLGSPEGTLYRVLDLPADPTMNVVLERWDAGSATAVVHTSSSLDSTDDNPRAILDLATGTVTPDDRGMQAHAQYVGQDASGAELWIQPAYASLSSVADAELLTIREGTRAQSVATLSGAYGPILVNPTGTRAVFHMGAFLGAVDLATQSVVTADYGIEGMECGVVGWTDAVTVLVSCWDNVNWSPDAGLWTIDVASDPRRTAHVRDLAESDARPAVWGGAWVSDGVLAAPSYPSQDQNGCPEGVSTWASGLPTVVADGHGKVHWTATVVDGVIYASYATSCGEVWPAAVEAFPADGGSIVLLPLPTPDPDGREWNGMTSWVPAR